MSKSGLFAHFRSKEEVQLQLLDHLRDFGARHVLEPAMRTDEGLPRLRALVASWLGWARRAGLPGGCPIAAAMFEVDDVEGPVRDRVVEMDREWREFLRGLVLRAMELGHLRGDLDAEQFVWELCGIYLSHHAADRFLHAPDATMRAETAFEALVARALP
jgi:AcrR family transcriptional regulator